VLEQDVASSHTFVEEEVKRSTYSAADPGQQLFLQLHLADRIAREEGEGAGIEIQPEEVARLRSGARTVAARSDVQGSDGAVLFPRSREHRAQRRPVMAW